MKAIYKRELQSYFHSFLGALFIGATLILIGIYFSVYNLFMGYPYIGYAGNRPRPHRTQPYATFHPSVF